jgi:hypothetical protein
VLSYRSSVLSICLSLPVLGFAAPAPLAEARNALDQWVQTRQLISKTKSDWASEKTTLQSSLAIFERERTDLEERLARLEAGGVEVDREQTALETEKAELDAVREAARLAAVRLEGQLARLLTRLPAVLIDRLQPLTQRLPEDPQQTRMTPGERLQTLVGVFNEIDRFAAAVSVESEIRTTPTGNDVEVQTLYLGLTQAFFVGEGGRVAGVGHPSTSGWDWIAQNDLAGAIQRAIAVYRNQQPPAFVDLPVHLR